MNPTDLDALRASLTAGRRTDLLSARIARSLGRQARPLPSRTTLAVERMAPRLMLAAAALCGIAATISFARNQEERSPASSIVATAADGGAVSSAEVFAAMTGLTTDGEGGR